MNTRGGKLTAVHWLAIALAAATGIIHLYLYTIEGFLPFLLGGLGYFGAVVLLILLPSYRRLLYLVGVPFVLLHIGGWAAAGMPGGGWALQGASWLTLGVVDKVIEIVLLVLLVYLFQADAAAGQTQPRSQTG